MIDERASKPRPPGRKLSYLRLLFYSLIAGGVLGGLNGAAEAYAGDYVNLVQVAVIAVGVVVIMLASLVWWRGADEAVREAHKWAWFWGGSAGIGVGLIPFALAVWDPELIESLAAGLSASDLFMAGIASLIIPQMLGYLVAWAIWWLRRR